MARVLRRALPAEGIYHVTGRGVSGQPIFIHDVDRLDFVALFDKATTNAAWTCHAWCLMDTHYHLILETSVAALSSAMHSLNTAYAQRFNRRHGRRGHLFEGRYAAWVIRDEAHLEAACRYVLDNPARAHMDVDAPWPWVGYGSSRRRTSSSPTSEKSS